MPSMMVSTTPCCARNNPLLHGVLGFFLACWLGFAGPTLAADKSMVKRAAIEASPHGYNLEADIHIVLNSTLENALSKGINLHFLIDFELSRPRDWWLDETIAEPSRKLRIYYHLLLRRYVVEIGYSTRTVTTLAEALNLMGTVDAWQVLERGALKAGQRYDARLRLRLDTSQLPKPLSMGAVAGDKWELVTPWHEWSFDAQTNPPMPTLPPVSTLPPL